MVQSSQRGFTCNECGSEMNRLASRCRMWSVGCSHCAPVCRRAARVFHGDYCAQLLMLGPSSACPVQQAGYVSFYSPPPSPAQYPIGMRTQLGTFWRCSGPTCGASAVRSTCSGGTTRGPQPPRMGPLWAPLLPPHRLEVGSSLQQALCRCGRTGVELRAGGRVGRFEVVVVAHHMVAQPAQAHVLTPDAAAPAPQPPSPPHATCIPHNHSIHCGVCVCAHGTPGTLGTEGWLRPRRPPALPPPLPSSRTRHHTGP
jgi:hypothetical protein